MSKKIATGMLSGVTINGIPINTSKPCNAGNYTNCSSRAVSYVVMHYTGNTKDTASGNCNYFRSGGRRASAHLFVDETSIYQSVELRDRAWHCGTSGRYYHSVCRNCNAIGIEMCTSGNYKVSDKTKENAAQLCAYICKLLGITAAQVDTYVLRHWDVTHKDCPAQMAGSNNSEWTAFKSRVKAILNGAAITSLSKTVQVVSDDGTLNVRSGPGTSYSILGTLKTGDAASVVGVSGGWYKIKYGGGYGYINSKYTQDVTVSDEKEEDEDMIYKTIKDVPEWYRPTVQKCIDNGGIKGTGNGELNLTESECRTLTILDNMSALGSTTQVVYKTINDVPGYYRDAVKKLIDKGAIKGTGKGELNISEDICRSLTILDRAHLLDAVTLVDVDAGEVKEE